MPSPHRSAEAKARPPPWFPELVKSSAEADDHPGMGILTRTRHPSGSGGRRPNASGPHPALAVPEELVSTLVQLGRRATAADEHGRQGRYRDAMAELGAVQEALEEVLPAGHLLVLRTRAHLAWWAIHLGYPDEGLIEIAEVVVAAEATIGTTHACARDLRETLAACLEVAGRPTAEADAQLARCAIGR
jgi:hypothetical protein